MSDEFIARASVPTDNAARYVKQLASHLGRRAEVRDEAGGTRILLGGGDCLLLASSDAIQLQATAATDIHAGSGRAWSVASRTASAPRTVPIT